MLPGLKLVAKSIPRARRVSHDEYDALINFFREQGKSSRNVIHMADLTEFAVWSGRQISEVCSLRWSDVNFDKRTCKLPGSKDEFPLLEKAWDIVNSRTRLDTTDPDERIFPYNQKSAGARHTRAKKELLQKVGKDLRFNDLRYESVTRLLEKRHPPHIVAQATGTDIKKVMEIYEKMPAQVSGNLS
jgi:integrase